MTRYAPVALFEFLSRDLFLASLQHTLKRLPPSLCKMGIWRCLMLPDRVNSIANLCWMQGIVLTGLSERGVDLLQAYVNRTADVQVYHLVLVFLSFFSFIHPLHMSLPTSPLFSSLLTGLPSVPSRGSSNAIVVCVLDILLHGQTFLSRRPRW